MRHSTSIFDLSRSAKKILRFPFRALRLEAPIHASLRVLREEGWLRSYRENAPVTRSGEPLPWYTYSAIALLDERLPPDATVFEYGTGGSTVWYASRVARVVAVEHNPAWLERIAAQCPANVRIVHHPYNEMDAYLSEIAQHGGLWDVVVIDGAWRPQASQYAIDHLSERGVVIWDNSNLPEFASCMRDVFNPQGFRELPLVGLVPVVPSFDRTSILYRPGNLLGI